MKKQRTWISFLRGFIYLVSFVGTVIGACVTKSGEMSSALNNGTSGARIANGQIIFSISVIVLMTNILWGIIRYVEEIYDRHSKVSGIILRTLGGAIWRVAVFSGLFLATSIFIAPQISNAISNNIIAEQNNFKPVNLSENYDRLAYIDEHFDELDFDSIKDELAELLYTNVDFGTDASDNISHSTNFSPFFKDVSAYSSTVTTLNKAKLSNGGHFIIFYTDKGDDAISDNKAAELGDMMERIVDGFKNNLDFDYEYEMLANNKKSIEKVQTVLESAGISKDAINTAMPVYVVNPYKEETSVLASYAGRKFKSIGLSILMKVAGLFGEENSTFYNSTPSYPFINILPKNADSSSLAIVAAHELGHHYASLYDYNTYGKSGAQDNFVDETAPNWMAINVLPNEPEDNIINKNHYNKAYIHYSTSDTISKASVDYNFDGYPSIAFLQNYYEIVPDSKTIIMDAVHHGNALEYLYDHAGADNFKRVMLQLAERNITGDYGGKLVNLQLPQGIYFTCADICSRDYRTNPASTKYAFFSTTELKNTTYEYIGSDNVVMSLLGMNGNQEWEIIESGVPSGKFEINSDTATKYGTIVIVATNYSITEEGNFTIKIAKTKLKEVITDEGDFDFTRYATFFTNVGSGCYTVDTNEMFDQLTELMTQTTKLVDSITKLSEAMEPGSDASSTRNQVHEGAEAAKEAYSEMKTELAPYLVTVCGNYIKKGSQFNAVKAQLSSAVGDGFWNIYNGQDTNGELSVFVNYNPLATNAKIYLLARLEDDMGLITFNIQEK